MQSLATSKEVAAYLGVHPQSMDRWASQGKGPVYTKIEGIRRYDWDDVHEWVEERKVAPAVRITEADARRGLEELRAQGLADYDPETDGYRISALGRLVLKAAGGGE